MSGANEVRILHWNIHSWVDGTGASNVRAIAEAIDEVRADVVSLVEVDEPVSGPSTLDRLAAATSLGSVFAPAFEYGDEHPRGRFGNAVLSRLPILDVRQIPLLWPATTYDGSEQSEPRVLLLTRVRAAAASLWIGSTHLPRADEQARARALDRVLTTLSGLPDPWLVVGDFNVAAAQWCVDVPELQVRPSGQVPTYPVGDLVEAIDYCIASVGCDVDAEVLQRAGSDHLPIVATIRMPEGREGGR